MILCHNDDEMRSNKCIISLKTTVCILQETYIATFAAIFSLYLGKSVMPKNLKENL